jgi:hypothetical protein
VQTTLPLSCLILLSLEICVLTVLARGSVFRLGYFSGFYLFVIVFTIIQGVS